MDHDHFTGISTYHDYDHSSGKTYISQEQDVEKILKQNKAEALAGVNNSNKGYKKFASVPLTVLMDWKTKLGLDYNNPAHLPKIEKLLQSNEYQYLRCVDRI